MIQLRLLLVHLFVLTYALYAYFNKGIAYTFLAEITLLLGFALVLFDLRNYTFISNKGSRLMLFFIFVAFCSVLYNLRRYPLYGILQDASMFFYAGFAFLLFYLQDHHELIKQKIFAVYTYYPAVVLLNFLLVSYVPFFQEFKLFGDIPLLLYKYGDMSVHLLITTLLLLFGYIKTGRLFLWFTIFTIAYLFLVVASYNRAGMLSFVAGICIFLYTYRKRFSLPAVSSYLKIAPLLIVLVLVSYANTKVEENFQGRTLGLQQLGQNIVSIFSTDLDGPLADNKVWRLAWWFQILRDAIKPEHLLFGQGVGVNLALIGEIKVENESLRAPHNFHLNILARFGWIFFFVWMYWIWYHVKRIHAKENEFIVMLLIIMTSFLINASFDVYLEGPMGALPFWTCVGLIYMEDFRSPATQSLEPS